VFEILHALLSQFLMATKVSLGAHGSFSNSDGIVVIIFIFHNKRLNLVRRDKVNVKLMLLK
jgi:hypothetical protein